MPSANILQQKKEVVEKMVEKLKSASLGVLVDYRGLTVEEDTQLREELRKAGVEYSVIKNTLTRFAANETGYEALDPFLNGPSSLALGFGDSFDAAKIINDFSKKNDKIEIKSGFYDGKVVDVNTIKALGELPAKEVLIAQVLGGFNSPIASLARVLQAIADKQGEAQEA